MKDGELQRRTKTFALQVIQFVEALPNKRTADVLGKQLLRAGTSVGANYRAACRARSKADWLNKLGIVEEEADECAYWTDLLIEARLTQPQAAEHLLREAEEITAMVVASIRSTRGRL